MRWIPYEPSPAGGASVWRTVAMYLPAAAIAGVTLLSATPSTSVAPGPTDEPPAVAGQRNGMRLVVIDPGHGGLETGAVAGNGLEEKDVTLDIAGRLRDLIFRRIGLQVRLTRDSDIDMPLEGRTENANNCQADVFISIHANAYRGRVAQGPETFFLSDTASDEVARGLAGIENRSTGARRGAGNSPGSAAQERRAQLPELEFLLWDLAQKEHLRQSQSLAEHIQGELNSLWQIRDRGVKQAPFRVLKGATMPAVLVEVGFMSNAGDAARLANANHRQRIAEAIFNALNGFRSDYAVLAGAAPPN